MRKHAVEMEFCRHLEITPKPPGVTSLDFLEPTQKYALNWERAPFCSLGKASQGGGHPISDQASSSSAAEHTMQPALRKTGPSSRRVRHTAGGPSTQRPAPPSRAAESRLLGS